MNERVAPAQLGTGAFVAVIGPSGAGKDTLIELARRSLAGEPRFVFPRRIVTRPSSGAEDHDTLTPEAFELAAADGRFPLHWRAHGLGYALPGSVETALAAGGVVVCNLSRAVVPLARARFETVRAVLVTAPAEVLAARIAARGRAEDGPVGERLARTVPTEPADLTIDNVGSPEAAAERLVAFLRALG